MERGAVLHQRNRRFHRRAITRTTCQSPFRWPSLYSPSPLYFRLQRAAEVRPARTAEGGCPHAIHYAPRFVFNSTSNCSMWSSFSSAARRSSMLSAAISDFAWLRASLCAHLALHAVERGGARSVACGHTCVAGLATARARRCCAISTSLLAWASASFCSSCAMPSSGSPPAPSDRPSAGRSRRSARDSYRRAPEPRAPGRLASCRRPVRPCASTRLTLSSFSLCFFSSRCWSAMAIATCVFTCSKLVLHVQNDLLDHFFRVFGLVDQVVEIGPDQSGNSF